MPQSSPPSLKGFTLIEVLVSLVLFSLTMMFIMGVFAQGFGNYRYARGLQRDIENAQFAINTLTKELRTSTIVAPLGVQTDTPSVKFYDYSQGACIIYRVNASKLEVAKVAANFPFPQVPPKPGVTCSGLGMGAFAFSTVSTGIITGGFMVTNSIPRVAGPPLSAGQVGKVTIYLDVSEDAKHHARIQSSASLRDYGYVGIP